MRLLRGIGRLYLIRSLNSPPVVRRGTRQVSRLVLLICIGLLPYQATGALLASTQPPTRGAAVLMPTVTGMDFTLRGTQFQADSSEAREKGLKEDLTLPAGSREMTFTADPTRAPIDFTDVAPHWWAETPEGTSVDIEIRTSPDNRRWEPWEQVDLEDIIMPTDTITRTYGGMVAVSQKDRTHRYVQSRVTLRTTRPGVSPVFHELTYTFINAGVTPNPMRTKPRAQSPEPGLLKPPVISRKEWGSPQGASSPKWAPKYRRVTHIIIHHTATPNTDTDYAARVRAIWYFHTYTRGWGDIGYNYIIDPNGVIYEGRAGGDDVEAGHSYPFNVGTMGIGMLGNFMTVAPSAAAQASLIDLISWKVNQRGIDPLGTEPITGYTNCGSTISLMRPTIAGHRDYRGAACGRAFNKSTCPGDRLWSMLPQIRSAVVSEQPPLRAFFTKHDTPGNIQPGATIDVHLTIRNAGSQVWQVGGPGAVVVGYQWQTPDGKTLKNGWKDLRSSLPANVSFADTVTVTAKLNAPTVPGHYALIWDMFAEGQGWFATHGSRPLRVDVVVGTGVGDDRSPESSVLPLPVYSNSPEITVRWAGQDQPKGAGIASYDVQYRVAPNGQWVDWQSATSQTQATFDGQDGYTYEYRARARDAAGNLEAWPDKPDAYTTVDTRPPVLDITTPTNGSYVQPGRVVVTGHTEPGAFVAVNNTRAQEVSGVFTATIEVSGRDFLIHATAADPAGNTSRVEITVQAAARFSDVPMNHQAFIAVEYLSEKGVIAGYSDGTFKPNLALSRAPLAKMLAAGLQWSLIRPPEGRFSDVPPDNGMYPYVETAAARGVLQGFSDGKFRPGAWVSRAQMVRAIVRAAGWKPTGRSGLFLDVPRGHWAADDIQAAWEHGVIAPDDEGYFHPSAPVTRGDASIMIYNMLKDIEKSTPAPEDEGPE